MTDDERDAEIEMLRAQVAALTAKKQRAKRVKPEAVPYDVLLQQLPLDAHAAWQGWIAVVAAKNKGGTIAESRRDSLLQDLLRRCAGLSADAIAYGLCEATKGGKDSVGYAAVAAQNYQPRAQGGYAPQTYTPQPKHSPSAHERASRDAWLQQQAADERAERDAWIAAHPELAGLTGDALADAMRNRITAAGVVRGLAKTLRDTTTAALSDVTEAQE